MVTELISEKRLHIQHWMWRQRLERSHSPHAGLVGNGADLNFLWGVDGGGVDHLGRLITQPGVDLRYFHEPLVRFEPRLLLSSGADRLAMPYVKALERDNPLLRVVRMLVEYDNEWSTLRVSNRLVTQEPETVPTLIKESRGLLAAEAMLRELGARALVYVSDPVPVVDRLFEEQGLDTPYLEQELRSVLAPYFLARFLRRDYSDVLHAVRRVRRLKTARHRTVLQRVLTVALIHHMFRMLAARYPGQVVLADYEQLVREPLILEDLLQRLYGERGLQIGRAVTVGATFIPNGKDYPVWKSAWPERVRAGFLTDQEISACRQVLLDSGLGGSPVPRSGDAGDIVVAARSA